MSDNPFSNISSDSLRQAADIRDQIDSLQNQLATLLSGAGAAAPTKRRGRAAGQQASSKTAKKGKKAKRKISPEGLERIRAAQRARWAKAKKKK